MQQIWPKGRKEKGGGTPRPGREQGTGTAAPRMALPIVGILAIAAVEGYALNQGINGTALTAALTAIAALGGAGIGRLLK